MRKIIGLAALVGVALSQSALAQTAPTLCDELAGDPFLPRLPQATGAYRIADPSAASAACSTARAEHPDAPLLTVWLARAQLAQSTVSQSPFELLSSVASDIPAVALGWLGQAYQDGGAGAASGEVQARSYFQQACDVADGLASARGCTGLAVMMIEGRGGPEDQSAGFALLGAHCEMGWGPACLDLALQSELRGDNAPDRIVGLFTQACDLGELYACAQLGFRYELGEGVLPDFGRAVTLYTRACDGGEPEGCTNLGAAYQQGVGVVPDIAEAARLFEIGCNGNDPFACMSLGDILEAGRGLPADPARAALLFEKACEWGDPEACDRFDALR